MAFYDSELRGWNDRMSRSTSKVFVDNRINYALICNKSRIDEYHKTENSICIFAGPCWSGSIYRTKTFNLNISLILKHPSVTKWRPRNYKFSDVDTNFYISTNNVVNKQTIPYSNSYQKVSNDTIYQYEYISDISSSDYDNTEIIMDMRAHFLKYVNDYVIYDEASETNQKIELLYNSITETLSSSNVEPITQLSSESPTIRDKDTGIVYEIHFNGYAFTLGESMKIVQTLDENGEVIHESSTNIKHSGDIIIRDAVNREKFWKVEYNDSEGFTYNDLGDRYYHDNDYPEFNTDMTVDAKIYQAPYIDWYNNTRYQKNRIFYHLGFNGNKLILPAIKLKRDQTIHSFKFTHNKLNKEYYNNDNFAIVLWNSDFMKLGTIKLKDGLKIIYDSNNKWLQVLSGCSEYYDHKYYGHNEMAEPLRIPFDTMGSEAGELVDDTNTCVYMTFERLDGVYDYDLIDLYRCIQWEVEFPDHKTKPVPTTNLYMRPEFRDPIRLGNIHSFGTDRINSYKASTAGTGYHTGVLGYKLRRHNAHEYRIFVQNDLPSWFEEKYNVTVIELYDNNGAIIETQKHITFVFHTNYDEYMIRYSREIMQYTRTRLWTQTFMNQMKYDHKENYGELQLLIWQLPINNPGRYADNPEYVDGEPSIYSSNVSSWTNHGQHSTLSMTRSSMFHSHPAMSITYWYGYTRMTGSRPTREFRYSGFENKTTCGSRASNCEIPSHRYAYKLKDGAVKYIPISPSYIGRCSTPCWKYSYTSTHYTFGGTTFPGSTYIETQDQQLANNPQQDAKLINNAHIDMYINYKNDNYSIDSKSVAIPTDMALWGKKMPLDVNDAISPGNMDLLMRFPFSMVEGQAEREKLGISFLDRYVYEGNIIGKIEILYKIIKGLQADIMYFDNYKDIISLTDYQITNTNNYIFEDIPLISHQGTYIQGKSLYLRIPMGHKHSIDFNDSNDIAFTVKDKRPQITQSSNLLNGDINYDYYSNIPDKTYVNTSEYASDYRTPIERK